ncbi:hypothetical protein N431DRAFT_564035 [Stipitochalara longipes BDJ]|nr:hypothetical protein N431DRAFT_564035 [Stipitochalara longipes BDJ]
MFGNATDIQSIASVPRSVEERLAALEEQNFELHKKNEALEGRIRTLEVRLATTEHTLITLSPQTLGKQTHKAFALFPKLPPELRRMVWTLARPGPRVIKIFQSKVGDKEIIYSTAKVPTLLHTCQESRRIAKNWYELSFQCGWRGTPRVYFDFSSDFVYFPRFPGKDSKYSTHSIASPSSISRNEREKVKRVVQEVESYNSRFDFISFFYPSATEAVLVLAEEGMSQGVAEQSEFVATEDAFLWQENQILHEIYHRYSQKPDRLIKRLSWNLVNIQRARFCGIQEENRTL